MCCITDHPGNCGDTLALTAANTFTSTCPAIADGVLSWIRWLPPVPTCPRLAYRGINWPYLAPSVSWGLSQFPALALRDGLVLLRSDGIIAMVTGSSARTAIVLGFV
jgi:hypothetical protein